MSVTRHTSADEAGAITECAGFMLGALREAIDASGAASFAISGGSSPKKLFEHMAAADFPWSKVDIFWVDERCVPPEDDQSNYKMAMAHLIVPAGIAPERVHRMLGEMEPHESAANYAAGLTAHFGLAHGAIPEFDLIHRGTGPDAHTASLFPGDPLIGNRTDLTAATYVPKFQQWRVTLLPGVLLAARHTAVYAPGADKAAALRQVFEGPFDPLQTPSQLGLHEANDEHWFITV